MSHFPLESGIDLLAPVLEEAEVVAEEGGEGES
jgi:hypothetical protein